MDSTTKKETNVPSQGDRIPQRTAENPGIVPARAPSSSDVGLERMSSADSLDQWKSAEKEKDNDSGNEKGQDYGIRKDEEGIMEKDMEKESQETNVGSQDTVILDINDQVRPPPATPVLDDRMDIMECRKRGREKSPEEVDEDEGIRSSQRLRKAKVRVIGDSSDEAQQQQEQMRSMCHIDISDDNDEVEFVTESGGKEDIGDEDEGVVKEGKRGRGRPRKNRRTVMGVEEIGVREYSGSEDEEGFNQLSTSEMGATAVVYVERVDAIRKTCGNIKGNLSGEMKKKLQDTREIIKGLVRRCDKRKDERGEEEEIRKLRKKNKELIEKLKEKDMDTMKRLEEIGKLHETVQELKSEIGRMQNMRKDMERMQDRIKELEQNSPKRRKPPRGSDADVESDATICSEIMKSNTDWYLPTDDTRCLNPQPGCSWMPDPSPKKKKIHPSPGAKNLEKKRELVEKIKNNRERIKKEGTLGMISKEEEESERAWPMLPPPSTATPLPQRKQRDRTLERNRETIQIQGQEANLKPGFKLVENRIIKPGFKITKDKGTQSESNQERMSLENIDKENEWKENKSKKQKRRERREAVIKETQMKGKESRAEDKMEVVTNE
ncbi:hypothetical protein EAG_13532 [Camponotus floridanus]|uniref:Uncharacterized protein n=1 Tax=Camponotus floridanus TaxID=104421 RepID=E2AYD3_CAMFO|nr:hypothetical protein EAG_13532 [Camponotus floridanus]